MKMVKKKRKKKKHIFIIAQQYSMSEASRGLSVTGFVTHVAPTGTCSQDLDIIMVTALRTVQTNFDLRKDRHNQVIRRKNILIHKSI